MLMLVAHALPLSDEPLPTPLPVAVMSEDPQLTGSLNPRARLKAIADMMGLRMYEVLECSTPDVPMTQLLLPMQFFRRPKERTRATRPRPVDTPDTTLAS